MEFTGWVVFLVLAAILGYIRYAIMDESQIQTVVEVAPVVVGIINLSITVMAFKDDGALAGVLCFFVPFYSLYYVFFVSDTFFFRSILAALLLAFGKDAFMSVKDVLMEGIALIKRFIETQGEF